MLSSGAWRRISSFWLLYTCDAKSFPIHSRGAVVWGSGSTGSSRRLSKRVGWRFGEVTSTDAGVFTPDDRPDRSR